MIIAGSVLISSSLDALFSLAFIVMHSPVNAKKVLNMHVDANNYDILHYKTKSLKYLLNIVMSAEMPSATNLVCQA